MKIYYNFETDIKEKENLNSEQIESLIELTDSYFRVTKDTIEEICDNYRANLEGCSFSFSCSYIKNKFKTSFILIRASKEKEEIAKKLLSDLYEKFKDNPEPEEKIILNKN